MHWWEVTIKLEATMVPVQFLTEPSGLVVRTWTFHGSGAEKSIGFPHSFLIIES